MIRTILINNKTLQLILGRCGRCRKLLLQRANFKKRTDLPMHDILVWRGRYHPPNYLPTNTVTKLENYYCFCKSQL